MRATILAAAFVAASLSLSGTASAQQRPVTATDYYRLVTVGTPAITASGRFVAFAVTTVLEDRDRRHSEIWMTATDGSAPPYRFTAPTTEATGPVWSPDGSLLALTSRREVPGAREGNFPGRDSIPAADTRSRNHSS